MSLLRHLAGGLWRKSDSLLTITTKTTTMATIQRRHLPYCSVDTNLTRAQLSPDLHVRFGKLLATVLGKDEKLITVSLQTDVTMCRGGRDTGNAVVNIWSIGVFDAERNPKYAKQIMDFLLPELNIQPERIIIFFHPINKEAAGHLLYAEQS